MDPVSKFRFSAMCFSLVGICIGLCGCTKSATHSKQLRFNSYYDATDAFITSVQKNDNKELMKIFGPGASELIWSGDEVGDEQRRREFLASFDELHRIERQDGTAILVIGKQQWPFPIPLVEKEGAWMFDTASGKEEILNRRIGENELDTIKVMLAILDAQREYAMEDADSDGFRDYAEKFKSDPGRKNGLYWETRPNEEPSPLGPLIAQARTEGYFADEDSRQASPYHGYFYRMLTAQGQNAAGGEYDYMVNGNMIGGFAVIAYPAQYGNSGIMTFIMNHDGVVFQKDLGPDTKTEAIAMKLFDPDNTWTKVKTDTRTQMARN